MFNRLTTLAWLTATSVMVGCGAAPPKGQAATNAEGCSDESGSLTPCVDEPAEGTGASDPGSATAESGLTFGLGVTAQLPAPHGGEPFHLQPGDSLPTGAQVSFTVEVTEDAHLYAFQAVAGGEVAVLFPSSAMGTSNPLRKGAASRIPPGAAAFKLNDKDMGITNIYFVVSAEPMADIDRAFGEIADGKVHAVADSPALKKVAAVVPDGKAGDCEPLDLSAPAGEGCRRPLGEDLRSALGIGGAPGGIKSGSMLLRAPANGGVIVTVFPFDHVALAQYKGARPKSKQRGIIMED